MIIRCIERRKVKYFIADYKRPITIKVAYANSQIKSFQYVGIIRHTSNALNG